MTEAYRIQVNVDGDWRTRKKFQSNQDLSEIRGAANDLVDQHGFRAVRVLEAFDDPETGGRRHRIVYRYPPLPPSRKPKLEYLVEKGAFGRWVVLSEEEAMRHPQYGVRGWLAFVAFFLLMGGLAGIAEIYLRHENNSVDSVVFHGSVSIFLWGILWGLLKEKRIVRILSLLLFFVAAVGNGLPMVLEPSQLSGRAMFGFAFPFGLFLYFGLSRRVNVTLAKRIRIADLALIIGKKRARLVYYVTANELKRRSVQNSLS